MDSFRQEGGVVGVWQHPKAANLSCLGLHALQHRGQHGAGIVSTDGRSMYVHRGEGLVADIFARGDSLQPLLGDRAIGHVRHSKLAAGDLSCVQPMLVQRHGEGLAVAHDGDFVNATALRAQLEDDGAIFQSLSTTELLLHLVARSKQSSLVNRAVDALSRIKGAWTLLMLSSNEMIAARDPLGFRSLVLGRHADGAWVVAAETCALDLLGAEYVRDVEPGEVVVFDRNGIASFKPFPPEERSRCVFEYLSFARPDTALWGQGVYEVRQRLGEQLAIESPVEADLVIPVPDSGVAAALGYSRETGIPFELGLMRNHYAGRTMFDPTQQIRDLTIKLKFNPLPRLLAGKRVVVVDNALACGTTSGKIVRMLKAADVTEVHLRIAAPPTIGSCFYGVDSPSSSELIASGNEVAEIGRFVGADSIGYLSIEGMHKAVHQGSGGYCDACFSARYPVMHESLRAVPQLPLFSRD